MSPVMSGDTAFNPCLVGQIAESALQELYHLDASAPEFCDRLDNFLHSQEYNECVLDLDSVDLTGLANYLDKVRCHAPVSPLCIKSAIHRLSAVSNLLAAPSRNANSNSSAFTASVKYTGHHTRFRQTFKPLTLTQPPLPAMS